MPNSDLKYTREHEWVRLEAGVATVGITDHAQQALSDIVYVELPAVGAAFAKGEEAVVLESTKAAASVYAPAAGEVVEVNEALPEDPGLVNRDCYGEGWMVKLKLEDESALAGLLDAAGYEALLAEEDG
jgi:glycine cleavage system H protein